MFREKQNEQYVKQIADITDEEGLKQAYETKYGLYQHYDQLFAASTKGFPTDRIDDLKLPLDYTFKQN